MDRIMETETDTRRRVAVEMVKTVLDSHNYSVTLDVLNAVLEHIYGNDGFQDYLNELSPDVHDSVISTVVEFIG